MKKLYRPFSYYATEEQRDRRALEAFDTPPPDDDEREAIDRALTRERARAAS